MDRSKTNMITTTKSITKILDDKTTITETVTKQTLKMSTASKLCIFITIMVILLLILFILHKKLQKYNSSYQNDNYYYDGYYYDGYGDKIETDNEKNIIRNNYLVDKIKNFFK